MLTPEDNELLTRVEGDAPMGRMLRRHHWVPALRAARLEADGAPVRVRLFGQNLVAFRATDGRIGMFDEACPHRGASLTLARNEDCALRCIFHGWKFDVSGKVIEVPTEPNYPERLMAGVKLKHYPVREAGGLVWTYLGDLETPPQFPDFGFTTYPDTHLSVAVTPLPFNWVQGIEATIDSAHIAFLHRDWMEGLNGIYEAAAENMAPDYEIEDRPYGFRGAALRPLRNGTTHVRITEYIMPYYTSQPTRDGQGSFQILVPIDDVNTNWWFIRWTKNPPVRLGNLAPKDTDPDNWVPLPGTAETAWGQDRESMKKGSFAGFNISILTEDTVCQASMGPIVDRSQEHLSTGDKAVVRVRRMLLQAVGEFMEGRPPMGTDPGICYREIHGCMDVLPSGQVWQEHLTFAESDWSLEAAE